MPATHLVAPGARLARLVLLGALACALTALSLPDLAPTPVPMTPVVALERPVLAPAPHLLVRPVTRPAAARPVHRASRSLTRLALWVRPVDAGIVSPYGPRWGSFHPGVDFGAHYGTPIRAAGTGVVVGAGYLPDENGYGQIVLIRHAGGVITAYAHTSRMFVHTGEHVAAGQIIALVGATGHVTGPHLHFEVRIGGRKLNPVPWLRAHGIRV